MAQPISIQFTRFSAFYSPLIATIAGGFLKPIFYSLVLKVPVIQLVRGTADV